VPVMIEFRWTSSTPSLIPGPMACVRIVVYVVTDFVKIPVGVDIFARVAAAVVHFVIRLVEVRVGAVMPERWHAVGAWICEWGEWIHSRKK